MKKISNHWKRPPRKFPIIGNFAFAALAIAIAAAWFAPAARAQQNTPHIGYIFPAGGQHGSTFEVVIGGQYLNGVSNVCVSGNGVSAVVTKHTKTLTVQQLNGIRNNIEKLMALDDIAKTNAARKGEAEKLRDQLTTTLKGAGIEEVSLRAIRDYARKNDISKKSAINPAISESVDLKFTIAPDAEPGDRELRLDTSLGLSNPMVFRVGSLQEFSETEKTSISTEPGTVVKLPAVVNGQILPGDIDRFRFDAKKGAKLVIAASARELIPYLADAVPGWFQATIALYDSAGKEVAYDDDFRFNPDPVLFYEIPADGQYTMEIRDSIYRGREDFVYRITVGEVPFITSMFPLGGPAGTETKVELKGWNLPKKTLTIDNAKREAGVYPVTLRKDDWVSNVMPFSVDTLPEIMAKEKISEPRDAQSIKLPVIINGRIEEPAARQLFKFDGKAGQEIVAEVDARRLNSPLDSRLKLTDADGKQIAFNDDTEDRGYGLETHHADSYFCAKLPKDGTYFVEIEDTQRNGGPEFAYRLRISEPRPDFALRVVPSSINSRFGGSVPVTIYALRRDGFTNAISLNLKNAPSGIRINGGGVLATQETAKVTISMPGVSLAKPVELQVEGRATVCGKEIVHTAVPAEDMMQAFAYRHLVPEQELLAASGGGKAFSKFGGGGGKAAERFKNAGGSIKVVSSLPAKIPAGGTAIVKLNVPGYQMAEKAELELNDPPAGVTIKKFTVMESGGEITLACDASKSKAGTKGNLIIDVYAKKSASPDKPKIGGGRFQITTLPAIPFEIVAK